MYFHLYLQLNYSCIFFCHHLFFGSKNIVRIFCHSNVSWKKTLRRQLKAPQLINLSGSQKTHQLKLYFYMDRLCRFFFWWWLFNQWCSYLWCYLLHLRNYCCQLRLKQNTETVRARNNFLDNLHHRVNILKKNWRSTYSDKN